MSAAIGVLRRTLNSKVVASGKVSDLCSADKGFKSLSERRLSQPNYSAPSRQLLGIQFWHTFQLRHSCYHTNIYIYIHTHTHTQTHTQYTRII